MKRWKTPRMDRQFLPFYTPGLTLALDIVKRHNKEAEAEIRTLLHSTGAHGSDDEGEAPAPRQRRPMSASARKRIAAAQKKRWAEYHKKEGKPPAKKASRRKISRRSEGLPLIADRKHAIVAFAKKHDGAFTVQDFRKSTNGTYPEEYFRSGIFADLRSMMGAGQFKKTGTGQYEIRE